MNTFTGQKTNGIDPNAAMSYEEIGARMGISKSEVRRLYTSAILKLRKRRRKFAFILELAKMKGTGWVLIALLAFSGCQKRVVVEVPAEYHFGMTGVDMKGCEAQTITVVVDGKKWYISLVCTFRGVPGATIHTYPLVMKGPQ